MHKADPVFGCDSGHPARCNRVDVGGQSHLAVGAIDAGLCRGIDHGGRPMHAERPGEGVGIGDIERGTIQANHPPIPSEFGSHQAPCSRDQ